MFRRPPSTTPAPHLLNSEVSPDNPRECILGGEPGGRVLDTHSTLATRHFSCPRPCPSPPPTSCVATPVVLPVPLPSLGSLPLPSYRSPVFPLSGTSPTPDPSWVPRGPSVVHPYTPHPPPLPVRSDLGIHRRLVLKGPTPTSRDSHPDPPHSYPWNSTPDPTSLPPQVGLPVTTVAPTHTPPTVGGDSGGLSSRVRKGRPLGPGPQGEPLGVKGVDV